MSEAAAQPLVRRALASRPWARGVALYSVRADVARDPAGTFARLAALGFRSVEVRGCAPTAVPALRDALQGAGLVAPVMVIEPSPSPLEQLEAARALGAESLVVPAALPYFSMSGGRFVWRDAVPPAEMRAFARSLGELARAARSAGVGLLYHLHDRDYQPLEDGWSTLDLLLGALTPELLQFEVDTGWLAVAGADLPGTMVKLRGRVRSIHLKDHDPARPPTPKGADMVAPGKGRIDLAPMLEALRHCGARHCFVELEPFADPWPELEQSQRWLEAAGY